MPISNTFGQQIMRSMRKEDNDYRRLVARVGRLGIALDEHETEELTTEDLARKVLKKLGLEVPTNGNSLEKLNAWLDGHEHADDRLRGVRSSMDSTEMPKWFTDITK